MPRKRKTLEEFFWLRVVKSDGCWEWQGRFDGVGYGTIQLYAGAKRVGAHRASWTIHNGPIASSRVFVCHHCDNRKCVRPDHLFLGSQKENLADASRKGRLSVPGKGHLRNRTHCIHGHPFSDENTYRWKNKRLCRTCHRQNEERRRQCKSQAGKLVQNTHRT